MTLKVGVAVWRAVVSEQQSSTPGASVWARCGAFVGVLVGTVDRIGAVESC